MGGGERESGVSESESMLKPQRKELGKLTGRVWEG